MDAFSWLSLGLLPSLVWPLNIPIMAVAYKVRHGYAPVPYGWLEYLLRSGFASLLLALLGAFFTSVPWAVQTMSESSMLAGLSALALFLAYVPAAVGCLFKVFEYEDGLQALSLFLIYVALPGLPALLLGAVLAWH